MYGVNYTCIVACTASFRTLYLTTLHVCCVHVVLDASTACQAGTGATLSVLEFVNLTDAGGAEAGAQAAFASELLCLSSSCCDGRHHCSLVLLLNFVTFAAAAVLLLCHHEDY